ncbi:MAG: FAD-dependent oxidoreductase [Chloroflexota bacterium]|nr:FAD-binding oxidoreductase [Dehalococcoidia bacterium]MDW8252490.1 FAD-dependent oxidoreductase [Chloroflexota bacterium]
MDSVFDIAICGSGPIGAATAYALRERTDLAIAVVTRDPADDPNHEAAYRWAGGAVRLAWDDPWKQSAVQETAALARQFAAEGVALDFVENGYLFLNRGEAVPGVNLAGAKLVREILRRAGEAGIHLHSERDIAAIAPEGDSYRIVTSAGDLVARRVLLALGAANSRFLPDYPVAFEKRQVFLLDLPVEGGRAKMPHLVVPLAGGVVYCFVKNVAGTLRLVVGQEDIFAHEETPGPENYFPALLARGLADRLPFLADAHVLDILWGFDAKAKSLSLVSHDNRLFAANCGSAVRAAARIGVEVAERLVASLVPENA